MFAALRANDLIWQYVVSAYLKGKAPPAFDLLFWNGDDTNLPGPMFCWYLRNTYLENKLREPGATVQCGEPVDLGAVEVPAFLYASREDHIVPWQTAYKSTELLGGDLTLRARRQRPHRRRDQPAGEEEAQLLGRQRSSPTPALWLEHARSEPGQLVAGVGRLARAACRRTRSLPPRAPATASSRSIEPAPGRYVKAKAA